MNTLMIKMSLSLYTLIKIMVKWDVYLYCLVDVFVD